MLNKFMAWLGYIPASRADHLYDEIAELEFSVEALIGHLMSKEKRIPTLIQVHRRKFPNTQPPAETGTDPYVPALDVSWSDVPV